MHATEQNPAYRYEDDFVPVLDGRVVQVERVKARYLMDGDKVVALYDINHRHAEPLDQCGPYRKSGIFQVYELDSMSTPFGNLNGTKEVYEGIYLRDADGNRRTLGYVDADSWVFVLDD